MLKRTNRFVVTLIGSMVAFLGVSNFIPAIATAPSPPELIKSKSKGKTAYILYVTNSDKVLVRCYPGLQPKIAVRSTTQGTKEGTLTCGN
jgi:hypothetical protein